MKKILISALTLCLLSGISYSQDRGIIFPRAFAFAIDDMGWNVGNNYGDVDAQGPYRLGIDRKMDVNNYKCIVEVAKSVGVRVQGLFILSEMDRANILAGDPTTTWQGNNWDNSKNVCDEQVKIMDFVKENAAWLEFGLHGVGHEYWVDGTKKRAEWYCTDDNHPWPEESMRQHIQFFKAIMAQYQLAPENGHSFPESFVPCAYGYYWNPGGGYSTGKIMSEAGVKYVNTLFTYIEELNPPEGPNGGGFDNGVVVVNRINYGNPWFELSSLPNVPLSEQESDIIESHWSNWLAQDDFLQEQTNQRWIDYYRMVQADSARYIAKNTQQFHAQWLYNKFTKVTENSIGKVLIDNTAMPDEAYKNGILGNMVLKVKLGEGEHVSQALLNNNSIACYFEDGGYGFIYLPVLEKLNYTLTYSVGNERMPQFVYNDGTFNVLHVKNSKSKTVINARVYGKQDIKIYCKKPKQVMSNNDNIKIEGKKYDELAKMLTLSVTARDFQGETGDIIVEF